MAGEDTGDASPSIDCGSPRSLFAELVAGALDEVGIRVDPLTRTYLVDLLDRQLIVDSRTCVGTGDSPADLAEALVAIRESSDGEALTSVPKLRDLGDRALFVAGYFRGSLARRGASRSDYANVGRTAYAEISDCLTRRSAEPSWPGLFRGLADRFGEFEELIADSRTCVGTGDSPADLAEALVAIRESSDGEALTNVPKLRDLGDRALFVAGYFRGGLARRGASRSDYANVGRTAYAEISDCLTRRTAEPSWPGLFRGLADRFGEFEELIAEVGEWTRPDPETDLLRLYDRYVRTGSVRDRAALQRRGLMPPARQKQQRC
jgi:hypothetical protein